MYVAERNTNAVDAVCAICVHGTSVGIYMREHEWDYLYSWIKKKLTIPAYLVMIKVYMSAIFQHQFAEPDPTLRMDMMSLHISCKAGLKSLSESFGTSRTKPA